MLTIFNSVPKGRSFLLLVLLVVIASFGKPIAGSLSPAVDSALASQAPTATFTWRMAERFGEKDERGLTDYHWDSDSRSYHDDYINPRSWKVDFNACASLTAPNTIFEWTIEGQVVNNANPKACTFSHSFSAQKTYPVKLTVTAPDGQSSFLETNVTVKDLLIVSIGDSFASGQGNPDIQRDEPNGPKWEYLPCHRSAKAGPALAALAIEQADPHTSVTFISFACSGARLDSGLMGKQKKGLKKLSPQMDEVRKVDEKRRIDALLLSIGGNDINFAKLVAKAILKSDCSQDKGTKELLEEGFSDLGTKYKALADQIRLLNSVPKVFITEYPDLVHDATGQLCDEAPDDDTLRKISKPEAKWAAKDVIQRLNAAVQAAADTHGWIYVDRISCEFAGVPCESGVLATQSVAHGYCAGEQRWVRTFNDAKRVQGTKKCLETGLLDCIISPGSVHPNGLGHAVFKKRILAKMQEKGVIPPMTP